MSISSAFLICHLYLTSIGYPITALHPTIYETLSLTESAEITNIEMAYRFEKIDPFLGPPLAECILEQQTWKRLFTRHEYPKPDLMHFLKPGIGRKR